MIYHLHKSRISYYASVIFASQGENNRQKKKSTLLPQAKVLVCVDSMYRKRIMNNQYEIAKRRALAEIVAPEYAANPKVAGVLLAGSVARAIADQFSDIEIDIYWHTPPTDKDLSAPIERAGWPIVYRHV